MNNTNEDKENDFRDNTKEDKADKFRKKTIIRCVLTALIGVLGCIVPAIILKGMIEFKSKSNSPVPGTYVAAGIIAAAVIAVIVFACIRAIRGALRTYKESKESIKFQRKC